MNLRDLHYFETIAELEHLGRAADRLHKTQPALSECLRRLEEASGEWVAILDSDDAWVPEKLEKQINLQKKTNADLLFTGSAFMDADGKPIDWYLAAPAEVTYRQLLKQNVLSNSSALVRKELYAKYYAVGD